MKSKRRHELKSNDLAHALEQMGTSFKDWGGYVIGAMVVVFVGVIIFTYMKSARQTALEDAYVQLQKESDTAPGNVPKSDEELHRSLARIDELGDKSTDPMFKVEALLRRGDLALGLATFGQEGVDLSFLKEAQESFEEVVRDYKKLPIQYGRALFGLFQVEANGFAADSDPARKKAAEGYLATLRDDSRLAGVPFQTMAIDRLNELDDIFMKVEFPNKPGSVMQTVIPAGGAQPSSTITIGTPTSDEGETGETGDSAEAEGSEVAKPEVAEPEVAQPEVAEPEVTEPEGDEADAKDGSETPEKPAETDAGTTDTPTKSDSGAPEEGEATDDGLNDGESVDSESKD